MVYGLMVFIVLVLLLLLHLLSAIQDSRDPKRRVELARKVVSFDLPEGYALTAALYAIHPHFFVLTNVETGQKIRVVERRWWARHRTPDQFQEKFGHPGRRVSQPGLGYRAIQVNRQGEIETSGLKVPFVAGVLEAPGAEIEQGLLACVYDPGRNKALWVFGSAPAEVFNPTEVLLLTASLHF